MWSITELGNRIDKVDNNAIKIEARKKVNNKNIEISKEENGVECYDWQDEILDIIKKINPEKLEKLCQRVLRELGFINVEVTGKSHDGGIDGKGILRLGGVLFFRVAFQAKRYNGTVPSSVIRDFREAKMGRVDKVIIITTGIFSREASKDSIRDSAIPIELIDGNELVSHLKELGLGVEVKLVEKVIVKNTWFENIEY